MREREDELEPLMTAYQAGSMAAFEELYARLAPPLLAYLSAGDRLDYDADLVREPDARRAAMGWLRGRSVWQERSSARYR